MLAADDNIKDKNWYLRLQNQTEKQHFFSFHQRFCLSFLPLSLKYISLRLARVNTHKRLHERWMATNEQSNVWFGPFSVDFLLTFN